MRTGCVAWVSPDRFPWWPAYVCDPSKVDPAMHNLKSTRARKNIVTQALENHALSIVYYFGTHDFGLLKSANLREWGGPDHAKMLGMHPSSTNTELWVVTKFSLAKHEAEMYLAQCALGKDVLPYLNVELEEDEPELTVQGNEVIPSNPPDPSTAYGSVGWAITDGFPFLPVRVLDPTLVQTDPSSQDEIESVQRATEAPHIFHLVFVFGRCKLYCVETIHPWGGPRHADFARGFPTNLRNPQHLLMLPTALKDAQRYLENTTPSLPSPQRPAPTAQARLTSPSPRPSPAQDPGQKESVTGAMGWAEEPRGYWVPVFLCDPMQLDHQTIAFSGAGDHLTFEDLEGAQTFPNVFRIAYRFDQQELYVPPTPPLT
ncbi:hypothetical protein AaE_009935 [Aphanomyces astaci]|uniref:PWWP domain-containing protein n=1 Tax=Aphanomyces astaci TaxID=112090 RepID=A0A6A5A3J9_APHAT|nr:hypothetical protein AaE_009935 [Aphanomyces astaci]